MIFIGYGNLLLLLLYYNIKVAIIILLCILFEFKLCDVVMLKSKKIRRTELMWRVVIVEIKEF